ncbi:MAG: hypothetical protein D6761_04780 [Candidatus Dadabacteria bacterium]|nr:MAG: hypothetical protein D6761_04780 [Candidatus Dadabacteria bacterium]
MVGSSVTSRAWSRVPWQVGYWRISMRRRLMWAAMIAGVAAVSGCGADPTCTAPEPTLSAIQAQIFDKRCAFSGCHGNGSAKGGLSLEAGDAYQGLVGASSQRSGLPRVAPGDPDGSFLVVKLTSAAGGSEGALMPIGGQVLCQAEVDAIRSWIADGAPDN